jgi:hypothetical protein
MSEKRTLKRIFQFWSKWKWKHFMKICRTQQKYFFRENWWHGMCIRDENKDLESIINNNKLQP